MPIDRGRPVGWVLHSQALNTAKRRRVWLSQQEGFCEKYTVKLKNQLATEDRKREAYETYLNENEDFLTTCEVYGSYEKRMEKDGYAPMSPR